MQVADLVILTKVFGLADASQVTGLFVFLIKNGAGTKSRTRDLLITSQLLYQLSYAGDIFILHASIFERQGWWIGSSESALIRRCEF